MLFKFCFLNKLLCLPYPLSLQSENYQLKHVNFSPAWNHLLLGVREESGCRIHVCNEENSYHDDVIKWKHIRVTGHLCGEFTGPPWTPSQRPVTRSFDVLFDLRLNKRLNREAGDFKRYRAHYDVTVMNSNLLKWNETIIRYIIIIFILASEVLPFSIISVIKVTL